MEINRTPATFLLIAILPLFLAVAGASAGTVLRVPTEYPSIQKALDAASPGDTVQVAAGTYFEHVTLAKDVILEGGWNADFSRRDRTTFVTVIDGAREKGPVVEGADGAILDGFTIIHGSLLTADDEDKGSGIYCKKTSPRIRNNIIRENEPSGIYCSASSAVITGNRITANVQAGVFAQKGSTLEITGNTITDNGYSGIGSSKLPLSRITVRNNDIHGNKRSGINARAAAASVYNNLIYGNGRSGVRGVLAPIEVVNNTVVANGQSGVVIDDPEGKADIRNNIITHNVDAGIRAYGRGYSRNLLFANNRTGDCDPSLLWCVKPQFNGYEDEKSYRRSRNIIADPLYRDLAGHDFHLRPGSPAIDAGDPDARFNDVSFPPSLGGETNDMGAYGGPYARAEKRTTDRPPVAVAGPDREVTVGQRVILDGRKSMDPDGDMISWQWKMIARPDGSRARLRKPGRARTWFKADKPGTYDVELQVTDRWGNVSKADGVRITVPGNRPPRASIGDVISQVSAGDTITLYGSASKDPDGDPLTYHWKLLFRPAGSRAAIADPSAVNSSFLVDVNGCYTVQLTVSDGRNESPPVVVYVSTTSPAPDGKRRVPEEYPTIQSAIDAAQPGDDIIVNGGRYRELLIIDKSVNLIGRNWPVIDGGGQKGDKNTVAILYLGDRAGRVEGFVITGGGTGNLGHGINIWDSAPEIYNNRITGNFHGIGIHGSPSLTGKTRVHGNRIYGNKVGIGNGKDSTAHVYENEVYDNRIVGIGCRGKAAPWIDRNLIHGNRIGIGAREVASPRIEGNQVYDNTDGIVISPLSTIKMFAGSDIVIHNNLVVNNAHLGIQISSFNLSRVIITSNTIDGNNRVGVRRRGGGLILGYPQPATFTAEVAGNIITNNGTQGIVNYIGPEDFERPGATLHNSSNLVWNNTSDYMDCEAGPGSISRDPLFVAVKGRLNGGYFLSQPASGQEKKSPAVDAGTADAAGLGLGGSTTRTDLAADSGPADLGYHYQEIRYQVPGDR
ncbi:right-handed parallel beta-helix repeat-containing protein [Thermodesulfobacteriota bacterium B35]